MVKWVPTRRRVPFQAECKEAGYDFDSSTIDHSLTESEQRAEIEEHLIEAGVLLPELVSDETFLEWQEEGKRIVIEASAGQWAIGEWTCQGEMLKEIADLARNQRFKHAIYSYAASVTGYSIATVKDYAYVARNCPAESVRSDAVSFGHHKLVASLPSDEEKVKWLEQFKVSGSPIGECRERMKNLTADGQPRPKVPRSPKGEKQVKRVMKLSKQLVKAIDGLQLPVTPPLDRALREGLATVAGRVAGCEFSSLTYAEDEQE